ncbi:PDDEXK nuclease domain-containing protein [Flavobacterium praedii]|uniref:PDDEXK nuclease domain-containing protein n=1 Tax=Flavobacterium praedii TaxID=3002900 RepID=UPI002481E956|nr:PDDEXK nuclease domain-containing protein [Flavobacterium praedii]
MDKIIVYNEILSSCITEIQTARNAIAKKINQTTISVYWNIGKLLSEKSVAESYGSGMIKKLSNDLKSSFPDMGLSPRNLWDMKKFYGRYKTSSEKLRHCVAVLPWSHNLLILSKTSSDEEALFYASKTMEMAWTRDILLNYIKAKTHLQENTIEKSHNFKETLSENAANYANEILKSSYNLGFLGVTKSIKERELENRLVEKIKQFILELGKGFSFIGNQYRLEYNEKEYFVDMLFFHRDLKSLVAIELKIGEFQPEYIGKMNFYLTLLDKFERKTDENQPIGIILCADKNHLDVEIALQDFHKPIGVAEYQLLLPKNQLEDLIKKELKQKENSKF